jgi:uncharacterized membrane protein (UPF0127 family)
MIINLTKNKIIAKKTLFAVSFTARGRGMIGRTFEDFDAMVFNRCNSIHTMLMGMKIDVLFVNSENSICEIRKELLPWKPFIRCSKAVTVIELPCGTIDRTGTEIGDILNLNAEVTQDTEQKLEQHLLPTPEAVISINSPSVNIEKDRVFTKT